MTNSITSFRGEHYFLSNFYTVTILFNGYEFPSVENAYQASKCAHSQDMQKFTEISAREAKKLGRSVELRKDWEEVKLFLMQELLYKKFSLPSLRDWLLSTGDTQLVEENDRGDTYWGVWKGKGENHLGLLLMAVRHDLKALKDLEGNDN